MLRKQEKLLDSYNLRKAKIKDRLQDFKQMWRQSDKKIFAELCFCLCTPQSKAEICDKAISNLERSDVLFTGNKQDIRSFLTGVRFADNKARYIIEARNFFTSDRELKIKDWIKEFEDIKGSREWLVRNIKGIGYKEASHFLRNIGFGDDLAILDRHILKNLKRRGVIDEIPKSMSRKKYLAIEQRMREFSQIINIPLAELDLLFWSEETGKIFK
jgi:N-glycosylase/DNA lyase